MSNTRYELLIEVNSGTFSNGITNYLDTYENVGVSFNFSISDVKDISSKNSSYSKTIVLPDTKNNRLVFQNIFGLNVMSAFNPNIKSRCWVIKDTQIQFFGYLQLTDIIYDRETGNNGYNCVIYAQNDNLFSNIGEKYLTDLSLPQLDHSYTKTNIVNSWTGDYASPGYYYNLMDLNGSLNYTDVVYNVDTGTSRIIYSDFHPSVYLKTIIDEIFLEAGYSYTSDFLNGEPFTKLILPFNNKSLTAPFIPGLSFSSPSGWVMTAEQTGLTPSQFYIEPTGGGVIYTYWNSFDCNIVSFDPNVMYNIAGGYFKNTLPIFYSPYFGFHFNFYINLGTGATPVWTNSDDTVRIIVKRSKDPITGIDVAGWSDTPTMADLGYYGGINGIYPAIPFGGVQVADIKNMINAGVYSLVIDGAGPQWLCEGDIHIDQGYINDYPLWPGEEVRFFFMRYYFQPSALSAGDYLDITSTTVYVFFNPSQINYGAFLWGATANGYIPQNIKQKDLLSSVFNMFNLYVEPNKNIINNFLIEPRDDFYNKYQTTKDWSNKLDVSQTINSQIISETQNRVNMFSYTTDKDVYNTQYTQYSTNQIQVFGQYEWDIQNDFITDTQTIAPIFSPTPLALLIGSNEIYLPIIVNFNNGQYNNLGGFNIRLLYVNPISLLIDEFIFYGTSYPYYPYAGYVDNPLTPTLSLNFGEVNVFYNGYVETTNNLFYNYWQNTMIELSDPETRLITAYFNLNADDIANFSFSDLIYFEIDNQGAYYRINTINDYDPSTSDITQVVLIKTQQY